MSALAVEGNLEVARGGRSTWGNAVPLFWTLNRATQKNENKIHGGVNRPPIGGSKHNNQPKTGGRDGGEYGGDMRRAGRVGEAQCHHFGGVVNWIGGKK